MLQILQSSISLLSISSSSLAIDIYILDTLLAGI